MWDKATLDSWCEALAHGEVVAAPAEGVYGYCCDPFNEPALAKLIELKQRSSNKGLICLVNNQQQLEQLVGTLTGAAAEAVAQHWPCPAKAPVTMLLPHSAAVPELLKGRFPTLALRWPACDYMNEYLTRWGKPLVSTSLNVSGQPPATKAEDIPAGVPALTLAKALPGTVSRIFDPASGKYLR